MARIISKKVLIIISLFLFYILLRITLNIVYYYKTKPMPIKGKVVFESDREHLLKIYLLKDKKIVPLSRGTSPTFSWDGNKIIFIKSTDMKNKMPIHEYCIMDLRNQSQKKIKLPESVKVNRFGYPVFSSDNKKLIFIISPRKEINAFPSIYLLSLDTEEVIKIFELKRSKPFVSGSIGTLRWFSNSRNILIEMDRADQPYGSIFDYNLETKVLKDLLPSNMYGGEQDISPNGQKIVFVSNIDPDGTKHDYSEIFIMDADGSNIKKLTNNNWEDRFPCWSLDGKQICFSSFRHRTPIAGAELFVINIDGTNERRITAPKKVHGYGGWVTDEHPDWHE